MIRKIFNLRNILIFIGIFLFITNSNSENYPNTSIGVLDLNRVLLDAKAAKNAAEEIDKIAKNIENKLYTIGISFENFWTKTDNGVKSFSATLVMPFIVWSIKKVSYAIAIPTINNKTANNAFSPELSIDWPIFWPVCTPIIEPITNIKTKTKSIDP